MNRYPLLRDLAVAAVLGFILVSVVPGPFRAINGAIGGVGRSIVNLHGQ